MERPPAGVQQVPGLIPWLGPVHAGLHLEARLVLRQWEGSQLPRRHHRQQAAADLQGRHRPLQHQVRLVASWGPPNSPDRLPPPPLQSASWAAETLIATNSRGSEEAVLPRDMFESLISISYAPPPTSKGQQNARGLKMDFYLIMIYSFEIAIVRRAAMHFHARCGLSIKQHLIAWGRGDLWGPLSRICS